MTAIDVYVYHLFILQSVYKTDFSSNKTYLCCLVASEQGMMKG
jgi:hypothetical protein